MIHSDSGQRWCCHYSAGCTAGERVRGPVLEVGEKASVYSLVVA